MRLAGFLLACLMLLACSRTPAPPKPSFVGAEIAPDAVAREFSLTDHWGQPRTMRDFHGKVVALVFGYTHCPDVCPTTLRDLTKAMVLLGDRHSRVQVLFVTLDPARDTQQVLAQYVPSFDSGFIGLRGDDASLEALLKGFGIYARKQVTGSGSGYTIDHSTGVYVFDAQGVPRLYLNFGQRPADIAHDLALLM